MSDIIATIRTMRAGYEGKLAACQPGSGCGCDEAVDDPT